MSAAREERAQKWLAIAGIAGELMQYALQQASLEMAPEENAVTAEVIEESTAPIRPAHHAAKNL